MIGKRLVQKAPITNVGGSMLLVGGSFVIPMGRQCEAFRIIQTYESIVHSKMSKDMTIGLRSGSWYVVDAPRIEDKEEQMSRLDGGPAFPTHPTNELLASSGMSLRDWFAGMAMQGIVSACWRRQLAPKREAAMAYRYADALLRQREQP